MTKKEKRETRKEKGKMEWLGVDDMENLGTCQ